MISAEELYKIYQKKRSSFSEQLSDENHKIIQDKLLHCVFTVDLAVLTFQELAENLPKIVDYLKKEYEASQDSHAEMVETLEDSIALAEKISDEGMRKSHFSLIDTMAKSHNETQQLRYTLADINSQAINLSIESAFSSLPILLQSNNTDRILEALQKLVFNILGLIPGGGVVPGAHDVYSILTARRKRTESASDYLGQLDEFLQMAYTWCISTQMLIDLISNLKDLDNEDFSLSYEESSIAVRERFKRLTTPKEENCP